MTQHSRSGGLNLDASDRALLAGDAGEGARLAMQLLVRYAEALGADRFIPIVGAHIDGCLYHGPSGQDFVDRFRATGARVRVPTTLNVAAIDLLHPDMRTDDPELVRAQAALIDGYVGLGCLPTLTCAPYQRIGRPRLGEHVAWAESNAIVFANSVLGARTDRYGDFADLCAALTGRVPLAGLHIAANRRPRIVLAMPGLAASGLARDLYFGAVGYVTGARAGAIVPALTGLPADSSEDDLKALGAAAASSGAVAMFHVAGVTPEAPAPAALAGLETITAGAGELHAAVARLSAVTPGEAIAAVCLGTPHFSAREFAGLDAAIAGGGPAVVPVFVSTARAIADDLAGTALAARLAAFGVRLVVDTCTYVTPLPSDRPGLVLTNSVKWAHYGPGNLHRRAGLVSLDRCIASARLGVVA